MRLTDALLALVQELRPDLPESIALSLVVEAMDKGASDSLDAAWAAMREHSYPDAMRVARAAERWPDYAAKRAAELAEAAPRPSDFPGRGRRAA